MLNVSLVFFIVLFIFGCTGSLLVCTGFLQWRAVEGSGGQWLLFLVVPGCLVVVASLVTVHGL